MSAQDKQRVLSILAAKVPQQDMDKISFLMEDGITADKLNQIQALLQKSLKPEEYKELVSIIQKILGFFYPSVSAFWLYLTKAQCVNSGNTLFDE